MATRVGGSKSVNCISKGGNALKGIGETYSSDHFTRAGIFRISVDLPFSVNNFYPKINLVCFSSNSTSAFGLVRSLNIPGVGRKIGKGVARLSDQLEAIILSGVENLAAVENSASWTNRGPCTGGDSRIFRLRNTFDNSCEIKTNDSLASSHCTTVGITQETNTDDRAAHQDRVGTVRLTSRSLQSMVSLLGQVPIMVGCGKNCQKQKTGRLLFKSRAPTRSTLNGR